ncbi:MAG: TolC family protein [Bacteroidaceae bacterium]|nr:TolC family protein [Bacteroidaceae bacterium]
MKLKNIIIAAAAGLLLTSCGLFKKYEQQTETPADVFGTAAADGSVLGGIPAETSTSLAQLSWREFFTDPQLQQLIEQALANNTDLNSARIAVEKSEAALKMAKMAYLPALYLSPQGTLSKFDSNPWAKAYELPLQLSVDLDLFGGITNKKRAAKAVLLQTQMNADAVRSNLVSTVAQQYYLLQVLDLQLDILTQTDGLWKASLETQKSLWENGKAYSTAVNQMESSYLDVKTQIVDTRRWIRAVENNICVLLAITPQRISRSRWGTSPMNQHQSQDGLFDADFLKVGVPAALLENRPDIRMANFAMEEAFYNTQAARAAFFPSVTLSGTLGWTNSGGGIIANPGKLLLNFVGQLVQPIFARGKIRANHKIAKLTEEDMQKKYVQTIIDAGNQVNEAMADYQGAQEKHAYYHRQVEVLRDAYAGTHELMDNGKASYLEVLTAQESLLQSQLNEAMNMYDGAQAVIALYIALGGGAK